MDDVSEFFSRLSAMRSLSSKFEPADDSLFDEIALGEIRRILRHTHCLILAIENVPRDEWPKWAVGSKLTAAINLHEILKVLHSIEKDKEVSEAKKRGELTQIGNRVFQRAENLLKEVGPLIALSAFENGRLSEHIAELSEDYEKEKELLKESAKRLDGLTVKAQRNFEVSKETAAQAGVAKFGTSFRDKVGKLRYASWAWLAVTGLSAAGTAWATVFYQPEVLGQEAAMAYVQGLLSKAGLVAILLGTSVWCGRMYRALLHQISINEHRQLSLDTFQAFMVAAGDKTTKDAVLMAATDAIFTNQPTGLAAEPGSREPGIKYVEISKSIGEQAEKASVAATNLSRLL